MRSWQETRRGRLVPDRRPGHGAPGLRSPSHALRRARVAGDVLHQRHRTRAHEPTGTGWDTTPWACDAAAGVAGVEGRVIFDIVMSLPGILVVTGASGSGK